MTRTVIAVDFDDVIGTFNQAYIQHHNDAYGIPQIAYDDVRTFDMTELYDVSQETIVKRVRNFCHTQHHLILPWVGVQDTLRSLNVQYEFHIVTSRCESLRAITENWILEHDLSDCFSEAHFTNGFGSIYPGAKRTKLEMCHEINAVALIEDAPLNALSVMDGGVRVLMPERPWNQDFQHADVIRYTDWEDVPGLLRNL